MTLTKAMTRGDLVTYLAHPEWNAGVIRRVEPDGTSPRGLRSQRPAVQRRLPPDGAEPGAADHADRPARHEKAERMKGYSQDELELIGQLMARTQWRSGSVSERLEKAEKRARWRAETGAYGCDRKQEMRLARLAKRVRKAVDAKRVRDVALANRARVPAA
jgi:hypothetical protein